MVPPVSVWGNGSLLIHFVWRPTVPAAFPCTEAAAASAGMAGNASTEKRSLVWKRDGIWADHEGSGAQELW